MRFGCDGTDAALSWNAKIIRCIFHYLLYTGRAFFGLFLRLELRPAEVDLHIEPKGAQRDFSTIPKNDPVNIAAQKNRASSMKSELKAKRTI